MEANTLPIDPHAHHPFLFLFIGAVLLTAGLLKSSHSRTPLTIALFLVGVLCGGIGDLSPAFQKLIEPIHSMSPSILFYIFFPVLIFEAAFNCNAAIFQLMWREIFSLAFPGMFLATGLTALFIKTAMYPHWGTAACVLYGAIISATDPVATLAILRDLGIDERVRAVLDGESIFNDGAAMVLYAVVVPFVERAPDSAVRIDWLMEGLHCTRLVVGALVLGLLAGAMLIFALSRCTDKAVETTLIYAFSVIAFFVAEAWADVSGVLTLCFMGLAFAFRRHVVHPDNATFINAVWEILVYAANVLIFSIVGIDVSNQRFYGMTWYDYLMIPVLYVALFGIRCIVAGACLGLCSYRPERYARLGWKEVVVIACNGLRGAVALTLALVIRNDKRIPSMQMKKQFVLLTAGQVCLTIVVNGLLCRPLVKYLGLLRPSAEKVHEIEWACAQMASDAAKKRKALEKSVVFADVDWGAVGNIDAVPEGLGGLGAIFRAEGAVTETLSTFSMRFHRLLQNTAHDLFSKGFLSSDCIHTIVFKAQQCLVAGRLLELRDLYIQLWQVAR